MGEVANETIDVWIKEAFSVAAAYSGSRLFINILVTSKWAVDSCADFPAMRKHIYIRQADKHIITNAHTAFSQQITFRKVYMRDSISSGHHHDYSLCGGAGSQPVKTQYGTEKAMISSIARTSLGSSTSPWLIIVTALIFRVTIAFYRNLKP